MACAGFIGRQFDAIAQAAQELDGLVVPLCLGAISRAAGRLRAQVAPEGTVVQVGNGAADMMQDWPDKASVCYQEITVLADSRERDRRIVRARPLRLPGERALLIDDVAVSGRTLAASRQAIQGPQETAGLVGLACDSRKMRRTAGMPLYEVIRYSQEGGGRLPVNSLAVLMKDTALRAQYAERKFGSTQALERIATLYNQEATNG